ncbi:MAG TPA: hypothetical protein VFL54_03285 [Gammaproteobacteria bacterium]|nr:hypothetical protein [Gammaproteobacteria bacterium]
MNLGYGPDIQSREGVHTILYNGADVDATIAAQQEIGSSQTEAVPLQFEFSGMYEGNAAGRIGCTGGTVTFAK